MRIPLIAGNWKMHGSLSLAKNLIESIKSGSNNSKDVDILVLPTFVHLQLAHDLLKNASILLGAQNLYLGSQGAFTGEVSGPMLKELGCKYVLVGHSERRTLFHEDHAMVAAKFKAALEAGLTPILCIGETRQEREKGHTERVVRAQLESVFALTGPEVFQRAIVAYEPIWAIGTGLTATPDQAQEVHAYIRNLFAQNNVDLALGLRILYGGSMKADNAASLLAKPDIDGGLIGGASLDASSFLAICEAAKQSLQAA